MPRDYKVYLEDILQAITKVREYTSGMSPAAFVGDAKTLDAVIRNLEVIGEASKAVPETVRLSHPEVDWRKIAGLRDILIHQYFGIDAELIWDIIKNKLTALENQIRAIEKS
ncbi:MAG: DUF86 domain-containing protein [Terriglobia bacterium]|jgi:uncharacterized protein with HEPN domain